MHHIRTYLTPLQANGIARRSTRPAGMARAVLALAALTLAACTEHSLNTPATPSISFGTKVDSRAAVNSQNELQPFSVWGWYDGNTNPLFDAETVDKDGNYGGGDRYWVMGKRHDFFALHPAELSNGTTTTCDASGNLTVTNFDCSATGTAAIDLMTACANHTPAADATSIPAVELKFAHELARVKFSVKSESPVTITSAKAYGFPYKGTLTMTHPATGGWTPSWNPVTKCEENTTPYTSSEFSLTTTDPQDLFEGDLLLIPTQSLETDGATLTLTYQYEDGTSHTGTVKLATEQISKWQEGHSYQYILTIPGTDAEVDFTVTAGDWETNNVFEEL